jgi:DNA-3-methyladenine glycosylase II
MARQDQKTLIRFIESDSDLMEGTAYLSSICPVMAQLVVDVKLPPLRRSSGGFAGLASIVLAQQLSVAAADTIEKRLIACIKKVTPDAIMKARPAILRACGLSDAKVKTLKALAKAVKSGSLNFKKLDRLEPDLAREMLTQITGIGPWTSDIYIMFALGHADGFAPGDLALQEAARISYGWKKRPDAARLEKYAVQWSPWRGVAARLLWARYAQIRDAKKFAKKAAKPAKPMRKAA